MINVNIFALQNVQLANA